MLSDLLVFISPITDMKAFYLCATLFGVISYKLTIY